MTIELRELPFFSQALLAYLALNAGRDRTILRRTLAPAADLGRVLGVAPRERRQITEAVDELLARGFLCWDSDCRLWLSESAPVGPLSTSNEPEETLSKGAIRMRRLRERKRHAVTGRASPCDVTGDVTRDAHSDVTVTGNGDVTAVTNPSPSHSPSDLHSGSDLVLFPESSSALSSSPKDLEASARVPAKSRKKPERPLPSDWEPTETELQLAQKLRLNEPREREKFKDSALAKGRLCADWNAAYRNWLRKSVEFSHIAGRPPGLQAHTERQRDEASRLDDNARQEHRASLVDMAEAGSFGPAVQARWEAGELTVDQLEDLWARRRKAGAA